MSNDAKNNVVEEPVKKTSKLKKLKEVAPAVAVWSAVIGATGYSTYVSFRIMSMNLETAKLQLEAAKDAASTIK